MTTHPNPQLAVHVVAAFAREANFALTEFQASVVETERLRLAYLDAVAALAQAEADNDLRYNVWGDGA